ncbi:MAG: hypothetical protein K2M90_01695, partial [Treponemataceae bacterium]|nr:hypothetical protein [Treponemataceae bacterium]
LSPKPPLSSSTAWGGRPKTPLAPLARHGFVSQKCFCCFPSVFSAFKRTFAPFPACFHASKAFSQLVPTRFPRSKAIFFSARAARVSFGSHKNHHSEEFLWQRL